MATSHDPNQNHLLAALPPADLWRLSPHLELVQLPLGEMICESGGKLQSAYFPTTSIVSLNYVIENGASSEIAAVGNEGMVGIPLFMGGNTTTSCAFVRAAGNAYKIKARLLMEEFERASELQHLLLRYTLALMTQTSQTAVCNRHHSVGQQLCRLLLLTLDRSPSNELTLTQEMLANMIGVRREGITEAAGKLQQAGIISYRRGHVTVLDRDGLEDHACECYHVVQREFERLLGREHEVDAGKTPVRVNTWTRPDLYIRPPSVMVG